MSPVEQCDSLKKLTPTRCAHCGDQFAGVAPKPVQHQVWDVPPPRPVGDEYQRHRLTCQDCEKSSLAELPKGVPTGQAGPNLIPQAGILPTKHRMSHRLVAEYLETIFGIPCSDGWISRLQSIVSQTLNTPYEQTADQIKRASVVHADDTLYTAESRSNWLWAAIASGASLFRIAASPHRRIAQRTDHSRDLGRGVRGDRHQ